MIKADTNNIEIPQPQEPELNKKILNTNEVSAIIIRKINAFNPFPGVFCNFKGKILKIWQARIENNIEKSEHGKLYLNPEKDNLYVGTIDGVIEIKEVQLEGKRKMDAKEFILANNINGSEYLL